jgi:hypothetical protein
MDKELIKQYSPIALVIIALLIQWQVFARPVDLEVLHREILIEVSSKYQTKEHANDMKLQLKDIQSKIDKIYDKVIGVK